MGTTYNRGQENGDLSEPSEEVGYPLITDVNKEEVDRFFVDEPIKKIYFPLSHNELRLQ